MNKITVKPHNKEGLVQLHFKYDRRITEFLQTVPGATWSGHGKYYTYPMEMLYKLKVPGIDVTNTMPPDEINPKLYPFQRTDVIRGYNSDRFMLFYSMGLGKTAVAIEVLKQKRCKRILWVCPAMVRLTIADEFDKWWPDHLPIKIAKTRKDFSFTEYSTCITSYGLLNHVTSSQWDAVVIDEVHYIKTFKAGRTKHINRIINAKGSPIKTVIGLSGTPMTNEPKDIYTILNLFWPTRFGGFVKFTRHYCQVRPNKYSNSGEEAYGINEANAPELRKRLQAVGSRVTKEDVKGLIKPLTVSVSRYNKTTTKIDHVMKQVDLALDNNVTHICILTHLRETTDKIFGKLRETSREDLWFTKTTGDDEPHVRQRIINEARNSDKAVLIATMHSISTGIDLTKFTHVYFAELFWSPAVMTQTIGRFNRLSSVEPANIYLCVRDASREEKLAAVLEEKIDAISSTLKPGTEDTSLSSAFKLNSDDEKEILNELLEMLK